MAGTVLGAIHLIPFLTGAKMVAGMLPKETSTQKMNKGYLILMKVAKEYLAILQQIYMQV
jgi:hypothetical protein